MFHRQQAWIAPIVALVLVVVACGSTSQDETSAESPASVSGTTASSQAAESSPGGVLQFGLQRCGDRSLMSADPSYYRDQPVYVANEQPTEELRAWAAGKPGFEELWIDRDHNGWVSLGFSEGVADRQTELQAEFPNVGVVAVKVPYGDDELQQLRDEVFEVMQANDLPINGGHSVPRGVVSISLSVLSQENLAPLAEFTGRPVCFDGLDPEDAVADGPQPTAGDGWRLLAVERTGENYRTGVAANQSQYEVLWDRSGVTTERPPVDFTREIVIWFGAVYGSGCEIRMDDVVVDLDRSIVHGDFVVPGNPVLCNDDANSEAYLVALERDRLPNGPFWVQLEADDPPAGLPEERTVVDADFTEPGSDASRDQIGTDPNLFDQVDLGYVISAGGIVEPGFPASYWLDLRCSFELFGPINGVMWQSVTPNISEVLTQAWREAADENGQLLVEVLLEIEPPRLSLSANGHTENYEPAPPDSESDCP